MDNTSARLSMATGGIGVNLYDFLIRGWLSSCLQMTEAIPCHHELAGPDVSSLLLLSARPSYALGEADPPSITLFMTLTSQLPHLLVVFLLSKVYSYLYHLDINYYAHVYAAELSVWFYLYVLYVYVCMCNKNACFAFYRS